ncbi:hypothetical protein [Flavobacterium reichenbachii]|uniref:Uncharacterized protein n=1 Tax=Flavobacterium reichenbachii TaxID=362418 RepID=A0A085ZRX7_9FLAO|nr:hypothetical protein [Flavobacterium reichenbachii]KFF07191.1 hypothetical protein IW19_17510 [Flavobacterium reichenbachii]OXB13316.1 hypothetical protein B0A68_16295 [Flavobacterium reichenbachii]
MTGNWNGYYKFDNERIQNAMGFEKTNFTIVIDNYEGGNFQGKVNDDVATGGMKETGDIFGKVNKNAVSFKKLMPKNCVIDQNGNRATLEKKHPVLYYKGTFSEDKTELSGKWFFKRRFFLLYGIIPILFSPGKGTWSMKKTA